MANLCSLHGYFIGESCPNCAKANAVSLRDYFAGMALSGIMASMADPQHRLVTKEEGRSINDFALAAYNMADAMLEARNPPAQK